MPMSVYTVGHVIVDSVVDGVVICINKKCIRLTSLLAPAQLSPRLTAFLVAPKVRRYDSAATLTATVLESDSLSCGCGVSKLRVTLAMKALGLCVTSNSKFETSALQY